MSNGSVRGFMGTPAPKVQAQARAGTASGGIAASRIPPGRTALSTKNFRAACRASTVLKNAPVASLGGAVAFADPRNLLFLSPLKKNKQIPRSGSWSPVDSTGVRKPDFARDDPWRKFLSGAGGRGGPPLPARRWVLGCRSAAGRPGQG